MTGWRRCKRCLDGGGKGCNNNVPRNKSRLWRGGAGSVDKERTATRSRLADVDNEITNDAPLDVFRENYRILSFSYLFSLFFGFFLFVPHSLTKRSFIWSVGRSSTRKPGREMCSSSTETVKFPALVLTAGALSCCKSILVRRNRDLPKFMRTPRDVKNEEHWRIRGCTDLVMLYWREIDRCDTRMKW